MSTPQQVYKTTIATTPEKLWEAIINPEFTQQYWFGNINSSSWKVGDKWEHLSVNKDDSRKYPHGVVEAFEPYSRLVMTWEHVDYGADISRVTFNIKQTGDAVELTVIHGDFIDGSVMAGQVSGGWPRVIANLKEFLETGQVANNVKSNCAA